MARLPFWAVYGAEAGKPSHSDGWRVMDKRRKMAQMSCGEKGARMLFLQNQSLVSSS